VSIGWSCAKRLKFSPWVNVCFLFLAGYAGNVQWRAFSAKPTARLL
jgi:hypothetical protein